MTRKRVQLICADPSLAVQSQKDEADINTIVRQFGVTGQIPQGIRLPTYGDFDQVSDYQSALAAIAEAEEAFMQVPAVVRAEFRNDPQAFAEFCLDRGNLPKLREWGLAPPEVPAAPDEPK